MNKSTKEAAFAAGCFWGVEKEFNQLDGVTETEVGFMGGDEKDPTYETVCKGDTCHAETVHLKYDSDEVPYEELLRVFFQIHHPVVDSEDDIDEKGQYRSVIFYYSDEQKRKAEEFKKAIEEETGKIVSTQIEQAPTFYRAEEYHQKYWTKH